MPPPCWQRQSFLLKEDPTHSLVPGPCPRSSHPWRDKIKAAFLPSQSIASLASMGS